jgi:sarcosine oxidase subunit gamma
MTEKLMAACHGLHATAIDVSHRAVTLELSGLGAAMVLAKGCPLDFHPSVFTAGQCKRSILAGQPILINARSDAPHYDLYIDPSLARGLWSLFKKAMGL